jgi:hypothetical protein
MRISKNYKKNQLKLVDIYNDDIFEKGVVNKKTIVEDEGYSRGIKILATATLGVIGYLKTRKTTEKTRIVYNFPEGMKNKDKEDLLVFEMLFNADPFIIDEKIPVSDGLSARITLPGVEYVSHSMATKGVATAAFGIVGLALTMGSTTRPRTITTSFRVVRNGVIIKQATDDNQDIKIPWNEILSVQKVTSMGNKSIILNFTDGASITANFVGYNRIPSIKKGKIKSVPFNENNLNMIYDFLSVRVCGQVEEGWGGLTHESLPVIDISSNSSPKFCSNCGLNAGNDNFCRNCGQPLN